MTVSREAKRLSFGGKESCEVPVTKSTHVESTKSDERSSGVAQPPDGGWGWIIVLSSFMIHVVADGVMYTFGIFYFELVRYFASGKGLTAWVPSIMTGVTFAIGPLASALTNKFGCRSITIIGSILAAVGLLLSVFASSVVTLFFTIGLCAGAGFGLIYLPAIVSVTCYFESKRAFATGIAVCGSGIGSALFAPLTDYLIDEFGWRGAMVIVSGLVLNCCVFGALLRPLEVEPEEYEEETPHDSHVCDDHPVTESGKSDAVMTPLFSPPSRISMRRDSLPTGDEDMIKFGDSLQPSASFIQGTPAVHEIITHPQMNGGAKFMLETPPESPSRHSFCAFNAANSIMNGTSINMTDQSYEGSPDGKVTSELAVEANGVVVVVSRVPSTRRKTSYPEKYSSGVLNRKDIFYSRSLNNLPLYKSNPRLYSASMSTLNTIGPRKNRRMVNFSCCPKEILDTFQLMMDFEILRNPVFLIFAISNFFTSLGYYVPHIYLKDRVIGIDSIQESDASTLLGVIGIGSTIGRLIFGYLSDRSFVNRLALYNICLTICGISTILSSFATDFISMAVYSATFGVTCGAYVSLTSVILVDLLGLEKLTNAFGILLLFQGVACLVGPPVIGWIYDMTQSYDPGFYLAGALIALSGLMLFAIPYMQTTDCKDQNQEKPKAPAIPA